MIFGSVPNSMLQTLFSQAKFNGLNTGSKEFYLSEDEKYVLALCNLARSDGKSFVKEILIPAGYDTSLPEVSTLVKELWNQKSIFPLMPAFSLYKSAVVHAKDLGASGLSGHNSSDGKSFSDRIQQYFPSNTGFAENYYQGSGNPVEIVMSFLLGKGETANLYKQNILDQKIHYLGISIQPHRTKCSNAVLDFARKPNIPAIQNAAKKPQTEVYWKDCPTGTKISTRKKSGGFSLSSIFGGGKK